jgi:signal transduction histidine kinase
MGATSVMPKFSRTMWMWTLAALAAAVIGSGFLFAFYLKSPARGLPYRASFAHGTNGWLTYDGIWNAVNGGIQNNSDERGAKLIGGSRYWRDYELSADVMLLGKNGDAGLVARASHAEPGVDAYHGYYVGLRTMDQSLVLGRADYGWWGFRPTPMPGGVNAFTWYHLTIRLDGCTITAAAKSLTTGQSASTQVNDAHCIPSGRIGLRSYAAGGEWRNVRAQPLNNASSHFPTRLRSWLPLPFFHRLQRIAQPGAKCALTSAEIYYRNEEADAMLPGGESRSSTRSIHSLRSFARAKPAIATVRGVVILIAPALFVQDATGGVLVKANSATHLKIGDEVEVTGSAHVWEFGTTVTNASVRLLWTGVPLTPVSVTSDQAATGRFDARLVELQGTLVSRKADVGGSVLLHLDDNGQSFDAMLEPNQRQFMSRPLQIGSLLRLRGVCVVDPAYTHNTVPFILLLQSGQDVHLLAAPPWWNMRHFLDLVLAVLALSIAAQFFYLRIAHWRMRAVLAERERLAHEMHDTMAQSFAGIAFQLHAIRNGLPPVNRVLHQQLDLATEMVQHSHEEARRSIAALHSEALASEGIVLALCCCAKRMVKGSAVSIESYCSGDVRELPLRINDALFRIGQEAIANAVRHANPTRLSLRLGYGASSVVLEIEDNGSGFNPERIGPGFGILGMRKRAENIAAELKVLSAPGCGTTVIVRVAIPSRGNGTVWLSRLWHGPGGERP